MRIILTTMEKKPNAKVFVLNTIIDGHVVRGRVSFSPAPAPGIMTELAKFEAQRIVADMVSDEIIAGRF